MVLAEGLRGDWRRTQRNLLREKTSKTTAFLKAHWKQWAHFRSGAHGVFGRSGGETGEFAVLRLELSRNVVVDGRKETGNWTRRREKRGRKPTRGTARLLLLRRATLRLTSLFTTRRFTTQPFTATLFATTGPKTTLWFTENFRLT